MEDKVRAKDLFAPGTGNRTAIPGYLRTIFNMNPNIVVSKECESEVNQINYENKLGLLRQEGRREATMDVLGKDLLFSDSVANNVTLKDVLLSNGFEENDINQVFPGNKSNVKVTFKYIVDISSFVYDYKNWCPKKDILVGVKNNYGNLFEQTNTAEEESTITSPITEDVLRRIIRSQEEISAQNRNNHSNPQENRNNHSNPQENRNNHSNPQENRNNHNNTQEEYFRVLLNENLNDEEFCEIAQRFNI